MMIVNYETLSLIIKIMQKCPKYCQIKQRVLNYQQIVRNIRTNSHKIIENFLRKARHSWQIMQKDT